MSEKAINKVVLAYSGGQGEEVEPARAKAEAMGIKEIYIEDLREDFARDYVFPMFRANAVYEGEYLLGTSIARPLIARRLIEIANETGADAISHGATGKGNDQVRFELMDANLLHISYEGGILEDPWAEPEDGMWRWTVSPEQAPDQPTYITLTYQAGDIVAIDGEAMTPATVMETLNRYVGMKSRGCYETPAGTVMLKAHRAIESLTLDREAAHLKDELMPRYATLVYNGYWWSPEREMLQKLIDESQRYVNGEVRLKLYKGNVIVVGRKSENDSLFDENIATFEDDAGAYDQKDAEGFIRLNALRLRIAAQKGRT